MELTVFYDYLIGQIIRAPNFGLVIFLVLRDPDVDNLFLPIVIKSGAPDIDYAALTLLHREVKFAKIVLWNVLFAPEYACVQPGLILVPGDVA